MDWNKVAVQLNGDAWKEFENMNKTEDDNQSREHRIRGLILKSLANALFVGLGDEPDKISN
jgi:hypothetical protein